MKTLPKSLLTLAISFTICLILGEIAVRIVAPQQLINYDVLLYRSDSLFIWRRFENINVIYNNGEGNHHIITDQFGYRINYTKPNPDNPDYSILAIGDSFLEAVSVENEETMPVVLAELLTKKFGIKVRATNAGISGWCPNQYYLETKRSLAMNKYDLGLIFIYLSNDFITRIDTTANDNETHTRRDLPLGVKVKRWCRTNLITPIITPIQKFLEGNSHLYTLFKHVCYSFASRIGKTMSYINPEFRISQRTSPRWTVTADLCQLIRNQFDYYHIPVIFVFVPAVWQTNKELFTNFLKFSNTPPDSVDLEQPNKLFGAALKQRSLAFADPLPYMRQLADRKIKLYGQIDRHLDAAGHRAIAEYLLPYVESYVQEKLRSTKDPIKN
ncbi:MAG: SGNH/GDSL hydrolase family protein [bacterium]|nr:SGNH/GDSL hydrolase family protein [bacterium]